MQLEYRTMAAFVLAMIVNKYTKGQVSHIGGCPLADDGCMYVGKAPEITVMTTLIKGLG